MMYERYPLVICFGLLLNMAIEIADLPINSMVIFHSYVKVYQRVYPVFLPSIPMLGARNRPQTPVKVKVMLIDAKFTKDIELPGNGHDSSTMRHV